MNVLITGGAGFIGSHLTTWCVEQGHHVRVLDNLSTGKLSNLDHIRDRIDFVDGDIRHLDTVASAMEGVSHVFHLAALVSVIQSVEEPLLAQEINAGGTLHIFETARWMGVERVVQASSCAVYGNREELPIAETAPTQPLSPYALTKLYAEQLGQLYTELYQLPVVSLRFFNVYGPGQDPHSPYSAAIPRFVERMLQSRPVTIFGDGEQSRDFVFVGDIVQALVTSATHMGAIGRVFNVGRGEAYSVRTVVNRLAATLGVETMIEYTSPRAGEVRHSCADVSLLETHTGYRPSTDLADGLHATIQRARNQG
jgi:nucleoside-diphosphate-sugar epimerase